MPAIRSCLDILALRLRPERLLWLLAGMLAACSAVDDGAVDAAASKKLAGKVFTPNFDARAQQDLQSHLQRPGYLLLQGDAVEGGSTPLPRDFFAPMDAFFEGVATEFNGPDGEKYVDDQMASRKRMFAHAELSIKYASEVLYPSVEKVQIDRLEGKWLQGRPTQPAPSTVITNSLADYITQLAAMLPRAMFDSGDASCRDHTVRLQAGCNIFQIQGNAIPLSEGPHQDGAAIVVATIRPLKSANFPPVHVEVYQGRPPPGSSAAERRSRLAKERRILLSERLSSSGGLFALRDASAPQLDGQDPISHGSYSPPALQRSHDEGVQILVLTFRPRPDKS